MNARLLAAVVVGGALLGLAAPPAPPLPLAEWLVLPALMLWFATATTARRPLLCGYLFGAVHMAVFSWSVNSFMAVAYGLIVAAGGLYYLLANAAVRCLPRSLMPWGFAVAVAATQWLRAVMPDIHYPHGQVCHCLWQWPRLLGSVAIGGEPLANALLAAVAATAVGLLRSWRVAEPSWMAAWRAFGIAVGLATVLTAWGSWSNAAAVESVGGDPVRVVAIEPGWHPTELWGGVPGREWVRYGELLRSRLIEPTRRELQREPAPDLILWPESTVFEFPPPTVADIDAGRMRLRALRFPASTTRLVIGASVQLAGADGSTPSALLVDAATGRVLAHHDKQRLVPGGEFLPVVKLLPTGLADYLRDFFQQALGTPPDATPGGPLPPLRTAAGVPFGAMLCYDNAFPGPADEHVKRGARLLVVLSNEAWFRGGGELEQLVAMAVVRALETATPLVRCTLDGWTVAIDGRGRLIDALELAPAPQPQARILTVSVDPGPGELPPMAWLRRGVGPITAWLLAAALAHGLWRWVRIRTARAAVP